MHVVVEQYQTLWPEQFLLIKAKLEQVLKPVQYDAIEHVGSTSVPGLAAKPVIDIDIVVQQQDLLSAIEALKAADYQYLGDKGIPDRYAFKAPEAYPAQNIYICVDGCQALKNHLLVRDVCRQNEGIRERYGRTKLELSKQEWTSVDHYCEAKNEILQEVLNLGGMVPAETTQIRAMNIVANQNPGICRR
ncbi:hypothetical protein H2198_004048 [Neophaeococcomyces mojaviensis]|uniref:Uncharacterized protein n=1 Tax=Neophaeococcomyces mojaviensis TaxID=3383035 RepID=A0ACC3A9N9_9EURO|nr:hypothetical protein H2198_004048 [Knufia sp. JES_112]